VRQKGGNDERDKEAEGRNFILPLSLFQKKTLLLTLMFFLLVKNRSVALGPMLKATPLKKRTLPIASSPRSKKKATPRKVKSTPKAVRPTPISVFLVSFFFVAVRLRARGTRKRKRARRERGNGRERERRVSFGRPGSRGKKGAPPPPPRDIDGAKKENISHSEAHSACRRAFCPTFTSADPGAATAPCLARGKAQGKAGGRARRKADRKRNEKKFAFSFPRLGGEQREKDSGQRLKNESGVTAFFLEEFSRQPSSSGPWSSYSSSKGASFWFNSPLFYADDPSVC
jgi:hypothetical protein